jgi:hypothetical protein
MASKSLQILNPLSDFPISESFRLVELDSDTYGLAS